MSTRSQARRELEAALRADKVKTDIDIKLKKQIHHFACYSAVTEAVLKYYGITKSQREICDSYPKNKNGKDAMQDPITVLKEHGVYKGLERNVPEFDIIKTQIDNDRPIICKVEQHYILLVGYDSHKNVYLKDPIKGNDLIEMPYNVFESRGFLTKYPTKDNPSGVEAHYLVGGYYLTKPPAATAGGGRSTRRANIIKMESRMRKGTRRATRRKLRGGGGGSSKPAEAAPPAPNSRNKTARNAARAEGRAARNAARAEERAARDAARATRAAATASARALKAAERAAASEARKAAANAYESKQRQKYMKEMYVSGAYSHLSREEMKKAITEQAIIRAKVDKAEWLLSGAKNNNGNNGNTSGGLTAEEIKMLDEATF